MEKANRADDVQVTNKLRDINKADKAQTIIADKTSHRRRGQNKQPMHKYSRRRCRHKHSGQFKHKPKRSHTQQWQW